MKNSPSPSVGEFWWLRRTRAPTPVHDQRALDPLHLPDQLAAFKHISKVLVIARRPIAKRPRLSPFVILADVDIRDDLRFRL